MYRQWFEATVKYARENEEGLLKSITEKYLVDSVSHTEGEAIIYDRLGSMIRGDFALKKLVPCNISDVFFYEDSDLWHKIKVTYLVADGDSGREKKVTQYFLLTANDVKEAYDRIQESLSNMLVSFRVPQITESSIVEVFPYEKEEEQLTDGNFRPVKVPGFMVLTCHTEPKEGGESVMNFTKGIPYTFYQSEDPEGWWAFDDNGKREVFFDPFICFKSALDPLPTGN